VNRYSPGYNNDKLLVLVKNWFLQL
jgi:hypothetical protein